MIKPGIYNIIVYGREPEEVKIKNKLSKSIKIEFRKEKYLEAKEN